MRTPLMKFSTETRIVVFLFFLNTVSLVFDSVCIMKKLKYYNIWINASIIKLLILFRRDYFWKGRQDILDIYPTLKKYF